MKCKAALYCRLSKEDVDKEEKDDFSNSIKTQEAMLIQYAIDNDFKVVRIYHDDDYSGLYEDRPGFEKLIADARAGYFEVVIAKTQARFTRNIEHLEKYLHSEFVNWGIRFIGVVDHVDTAIKGNKKARQINGLVNEWYCEDLSESVRASFRIKQLQGQYLASSPVYGYVKDPNDNHHLIPDPYAASVVQRIFSLYLSGAGKSRIARILTREGVLRPSKYKREVLGLNYHNAAELNIEDDGWSYQTINVILKNETYLGHTVQNKINRVSYKSKHKKRLPESEWIKVENTHEPIISKEVFEAVQNMGKKKTRPVKDTPNITLFSKVLFCADCGKSMVRKYSRNSYGPRRISYICKSYKLHGSVLCSSHKIEEYVLTDLVLNAIKDEGRKLLREEEVAKLHALQVNESKGFLNKKLEDTLKERDKVSSYKERLYEDYADDILTKDEYKALKRKYERKSSEINIKIAQINQEIENLEDDKYDELKKWIEQFKNYMDISELKREVIVELIDRIEVCENNEICIHFKFHQ